MKTAKFSQIGPSAAPLSFVLARMNVLVDWERRDRNRGMRIDLGPIRDLLRRLGNPQRQFRSIHVTGTKGKGSVCAIIEAGLDRAGLKVGRYSSPHVERVTERITFGGVEIHETIFAAALDRSWTAREAAISDGGPAKDASWFDLMTAAAFLAFAEGKIEWAIVEVGIGGRLDSTNAIDAEVAVITNVELEHTAILGTTRTAIAQEKIGILKPGATLVTAIPESDEIGKLFRSTAINRGCRVVAAQYDLAATIRENNLHLAKAVLDVLGNCKVLTRTTVVSRPAQSAIGAWLLDDDHSAGRLPGRMERVDIPIRSRDEKCLGSERHLSVILDGAHVAFNLAAVLNDLSKQPGLAGPCVVVFGLGLDKDAAAMLVELKTRANRLILTTWSTGAPTYSPEVLKQMATAISLRAEVIGAPHDALLRALELATDGGWVLVTGSLHLVGELRGALRKHEIASPDGKMQSI